MIQNSFSICKTVYQEEENRQDTWSVSTLPLNKISLLTEVLLCWARKTVCIQNVMATWFEIGCFFFKKWEKCGKYWRQMMQTSSRLQVFISRRSIWKFVKPETPLAHSARIHKNAKHKHWRMDSLDSIPLHAEVTWKAYSGQNISWASSLKDNSLSSSFCFSEPSFAG